MYSIFKLLTGAGLTETPFADTQPIGLQLCDAICLRAARGRCAACLRTCPERFKPAVRTGAATQNTARHHVLCLPLNEDEMQGAFH
jgi:hypothetical protein